MKKPASLKIDPPQYFQVEHYKFEDGRIPEIIQEIQKAIRPNVVNQFAKDFPPTHEGLGNLWQWVKSNIRYKEDGDRRQIIQHPARLNVSRQGDCKSMSLFVVSVLICWRCPFTLMFVHYPDTGSNHVYPVAHTTEGDIIIDTVWKRFNSQKEPFQIILKQTYKI